LLVEFDLIKFDCKKQSSVDKRNEVIGK